MTTELHLGELTSFQMVTHNLSACCMLSYSHAIQKWDDLLNTKAEFFFILHRFTQHQCISI